MSWFPKPHPTPINQPLEFISSNKHFRGRVQMLLFIFVLFVGKKKYTKSIPSDCPFYTVQKEV